MTRTSIAVLGTGMAGFGACHLLHSAGASFSCFDKNDYYGGHTRSISYPSGFIFDEGVHISFTKNEHVREIFAANVRGEYHERKFAIDNYWRGHRIAHPVQCHMHGLPADLVIKIIEDFTAARAQAGGGDRKANYAEWLYAVYGRTFADTFPISYGEKYHTTRMHNLTTDWIGPRMYQPTLADLLRGAFSPQVQETHYIQTYRYPFTGGFVSYLEPFAKAFDIRLNHRLVGVDPREKLLRFANGTTQGYRALISSIPLPEFVPMIDGAPREVIEASRRLAFTSAVLFNIGVDREDLSSAATTYFYDEDIIISRINLPHMFSRNNAPQGCGAIQAEVYFSDKYRPLERDPKLLADTVLHDLRRCGFIMDSDKVLLMDVQVNRYANVIYDHERAGALAIVHAFLEELKIHCCGRYGNWDHAWTDEAFVSGEESAKKVLDELSR